MVLASDSRGTFGDPRATTAQNDTMKKVYSVSKYVGVLLAGSGELGSTIRNEIGEKMRETDIKGATQVMQEIRNLLLARFDEWFKGWLVQPVQGSPVPIRPTLVLFVAGYDLDTEGKPTIQ
jgi:hypothetical protein